MSNHDEPRRMYERERDRLDTASESGDVPEADAEAIVEFLDKCDPLIARVSLSGEADKSPSTLKEYCKRLRVVATRLGTPLTEADVDTINGLWGAMRKGDHPDVPDDGVSANTVNAYQSATRKFFEHMDLGIGKEEIAMTTPERSKVNPQDMFTEEEIHEMRDAVEHPRNQALLDMLIYTGQRVRAVQTLRRKDIDLENGIFYLNDEAEGLKGADGQRPLLGAEGAMRDWLNKYHPTDDPDAYVFCHRTDSSRSEGGHRPISRRTISRILEDVGDRASIEKDVNPHRFRHYFVTVSKIKYDLDDMTIKGLLGHRLDSRIMEETYAHLQDKDHTQKAMEATGFAEPEEESPLSPDFCPNCDEPLPENAKACPSCGISFTPDAQQAQERMEERTKEGMMAADPDDPEEQVAVEQLTEAIRENPELAQLLADELGDG